MSVGGENIIRGGRIVDWVIDHPHPRPFNQVEIQEKVA